MTANWNSRIKLKASTELQRKRRNEYARGKYRRRKAGIAAIDAILATNQKSNHQGN